MKPEFEWLLHVNKRWRPAPSQLRSDQQMNMLDGTCWISPEDLPCYEDFMRPAEKIKQLDHWTVFLTDRKRLEERHQEYAEELRRHNWKVEPPRVI